MEKIVLDASIIVKWYAEEEDSEHSRDLILDLKVGKVDIYLPELVKYELANALLRGKRLPEKSAKFTLSDFYSLPLNFIKETSSLAGKNYHFAQKLKTTYYDACYIGLAKEFRAILISANPRHQKQKNLGIKILTLKEYYGRPKRLTNK